MGQTLVIGKCLFGLLNMLSAFAITIHCINSRIITKTPVLNEITDALATINDNNTVEDNSHIVDSILTSAGGLVICCTVYFIGTLLLWL